MLFVPAANACLVIATMPNLEVTLSAQTICAAVVVAKPRTLVTHAMTVALPPEIDRQDWVLSLGRHYPARTNLNFHTVPRVVLVNESGTGGILLF